MQGLREFFLMIPALEPEEHLTSCPPVRQR